MVESERRQQSYRHTFRVVEGNRAGVIIWVSGDTKSKDGGGELRKLKMNGYMAVNQGASKIFSRIKWLSVKSSCCLRHLCPCEEEHSTSYEALINRSMVDSWNL